MPVHPLATLSHCDADSRSTIIRDEIIAQLDMQLGLTLRDWNQKIDEALQPKSRAMLERALERCFPFAAPQSLRSASTYTDYAWYLIQASAVRGQAPVAT